MVVVFGATRAIGTSLVETLCAEHKSWEILAVTRSVKGTSRLASKNLPNVTMVEGDPFDEESVLKMTADCDIVYSCIGFHRNESKYWAKHWPRIVLENLLAALKPDSTNGSMQKKRLVFCDSLYAYGPREKISPTSSTVAQSYKSKPAVRAKVREIMVQHMTQYPGTLTAVGGADFCGPHVADKSFHGAVAGKIAQGQGVLAIYYVPVMHDFCFAPDFARALAMVSANDENFLKAADKFWICPHTTSHNKTLQEIPNGIAAKVAAADNTTTLTGNCLISTQIYHISTESLAESSLRDSMFF